METNLKFTRWRERPSCDGKLMTKVEGISESQLAKIDELEKERDTGLNKNGNKVKWTDAKKYDLEKYISIRDAEDSLPKGAISHLDDVFRRVFWNRERILDNKFLRKGLAQEDDAVGLVSLVDGEFYIKNSKKYENEFLVGTPDIVFGNLVIDTKCNYDLESFENAEMTSLYEWQIKCYMYLTGCTKGKLAYTLVNNPVEQIINETTRRFYAMGSPDSDNEDWIEMKRLIERNMIFDIKLFKEQNPGYHFENINLDFDIPAELRVKTFDVFIEEDDIVNIQSRIVLARQYLVTKEIEVLERIKKII